jgi:D-3-phosphoglycerate dehydrogenase
MTYTVVVATDLTDESLNVLRVHPDMALKVVAPNLREVQEAVADADALIAREDVPVDRALLDRAPRLKIVGRVGAALTGIDFEAATRRGVLITNTPGTSSIAAAEHTLALMLGLSRRLTALHDSLKDGYWLLDRKRQSGIQLSGKTLGIIGLGRVGRVVAQRALAFGMTVLAFDPYLAEGQIEDNRVVLVGMGELLSRSDLVTLHVPPTPETRNMVNADFIRRMKPGARLINTAFGGLMDEQAAADAVREGRLGGVAVDVYAQEPPYNSPLIGLENVLHTPHVSENTIEASQDLSFQIVHQVIDALRGSDYRNVANLPFLPGMEYETIRPYLTLAERIGTLMLLLSRHPVRRVAVEYRGEEVAGLVKPLTVALLKGLLAPALGETVSYINAPMLAAERGIQITQTKGLKVGDYSNLVSCQVTLDDGEEIVMAGTLLDRKEAHIVQINEYRMNFVPEGHLLLLGSFDQPGVIGRVGTLMAENGVNIASWFTGRAQPGGPTLTVLSLDDAMPDEVFQKLLALDFIRHAHQADLT